MPDVCRTFHFSAGSHISSGGQRRHFDTHSFNKLPNTVPINTTMLVTMLRSYCTLYSVCIATWLKSTSNIIILKYPHQVLLEALPPVCMKYTALK